MIWQRAFHGPFCVFLVCAIWMLLDFQSNVVYLTSKNSVRVSLGNRASHEWWLPSIICRNHLPQQVSHLHSHNITGSSTLNTLVGSRWGIALRTIRVNRMMALRAGWLAGWLAAKTPGVRTKMWRLIPRTDQPHTINAFWILVQIKGPLHQ